MKNQNKNNEHRRRSDRFTAGLKVSMTVQLLLMTAFAGMVTQTATAAEESGNNAETLSTTTNLLLIQAIEERVEGLGDLQCTSRLAHFSCQLISDDGVPIGEFSGDVHCNPEVTVPGATCAFAAAGGFVDSWYYCGNNPKPNHNCLTFYTRAGGESYSSDGTASGAGTHGALSCGWDGVLLEWNGCSRSKTKSLSAPYGYSSCASIVVTAQGGFGAFASAKGCATSSP